MNPLIQRGLHMTRGEFFGRTPTGIGTAALASLLARTGFADSGVPAKNSGLHFAPKAKRVIYLFQNGAPTHADLFDYKPKLKEWHGKEIPAEIRMGARLSTMTG